MTQQPGAAALAEHTPSDRRYLFITCFVALIATAFAFIIRALVQDQWQVDFGLSETQKGEISGAGLWPFGISIVLFSLVVDRIGYRRSMVFALICHLASAALIITARGYWGLYVGSFLNGLAAGTVEAIINPAVASMYPRNKVKMLSFLHAAWPGGFVLGGITILAMGGSVDWMWKVGIILVPVIAYGILLLWARFPLNERVAAGVPYHDMLKEAGALGALIVTFLIATELGRDLHMPTWVAPVVTAVVTLAALVYTRSLGRILYIFLLLVMILLAITELGTDAWIKDIMTPAMQRHGLPGALVILYTATIMMILRFCIGPVVKVLKPLGVLLVSSLFAAAGLFFLANADSLGLILVTATIYGMGQCYFWPVTIGLVGEQFPRGGALTLNAIAGVGMIGVGIIGTPLMGFLQDTKIDSELTPKTALYAQVMDPCESDSVFTLVAGKYRSLNQSAVNGIQDRIALYEYRHQAAQADIAASTDANTLLAKPDYVPRRLLANDRNWQTLVRRTYNHMHPGEPQPGDELMLQAVLDANALVSTAQYQQLKTKAKTLDQARETAKRSAMARIAILPLIMAVCYLGLILYFRSKGGYKQVHLSEAQKGPQNMPPAEE